MNPIDAALLVLVAIQLVLGLIRGAVWQVLKLAGIALGIWVAWHYGEDFRAMWPDSLGLGEDSGRLIAQGVLFLSVYLVVFGVSHALRSLLKKIDLGSADRILGGLVGMAKGALIGCLVLYLQFVPFVTSFDKVELWLYGDEATGRRGSYANEIFLRHLKERIDSVVPADLSDRVDQMQQKASGLRPR